MCYIPTVLAIERLRQEDHLSSKFCGGVGGRYKDVWWLEGVVGGGMRCERCGGCGGMGWGCSCVGVGCGGGVGVLTGMKLSWQHACLTCAKLWVQSPEARRTGRGGALQSEHSPGRSKVQGYLRTHGELKANLGHISGPHFRKIKKRRYKIHEVGVGGDSSAVKSAGCGSTRGPRFNSPHPHGSSQLQVTSVPGDLMTPSGLCGHQACARCRHIAY